MPPTLRKFLGAFLLVAAISVASCQAFLYRAEAPQEIEIFEPSHQIES